MQMLWVLIVVMNGIPYPVQSYRDAVTCQAAAFNVKAHRMDLTAYCVQQQ